MCAGTDEGVVVATGRAWMKKGWKGGSLWLAELVPAGLAWQLLSGPGTVTAWHCGAVLSGPTSRLLGRQQRQAHQTQNSFTRAGFVFQPACHTCVTCYGNIVGLV